MPRTVTASSTRDLTVCHIGPVAVTTDADTGGESSADAAAPPLPMGRRIELPGRGTTFVREVPGPPGAPTVVLLHGWIASGGLNWYHVFGPLSAHFNVVAPDLRGHGRGIRTSKRFKLRDCADDVAALLRHLDTGPVIAVGYSMGGPVAQLLWKQHRDLVSGMVLCATSAGLVPGFRERMIFVSFMSAAAGTTRVGQRLAEVPLTPLRRLNVRGNAPRNRPTDLRTWARGEMARHEWRTVLEAGVAVGNYSSKRWIKHVDVPTAVLVTTKDRAMPPFEQLRMALAIPEASIHRIDDGHVVCARRRFAPPLLGACLDVAGRIEAASPSTDP
jgi:pimeloyl-ACP methyl ester carboxylesterase